MSESDASYRAWLEAMLHVAESGHDSNDIFDVGTFGNWPRWQCFATGCGKQFTDPKKGHDG